MLFGILGIEESSVHQGILKKGEAMGEARGEAKGAVDEATKILLRLPKITQSDLANGSA